LGVNLKNIWILLLLILILPLPVAFAVSSPIWVTGRISSVVSENRYDLDPYYVFNFTMMDSNGTVGMGQDKLTIMPTNLSLMVPTQNSFYNFTGHIVEVQTGEVPLGTFVVETINVNAETDYFLFVRYLVEAISGVMKGIVYAIAQVIFIGTGYMVPEAVITIILAVSFLYCIFKYRKFLGLMFILILVFLVVSGLANLIRLAWV
jgi:hypothetical protein